MRPHVQDPDHKIIDRPWEYRIAELHYLVENSDGEAFIEMLLKKPGGMRRLRFLSPRGFSVDEGFDPLGSIGLQIIDVAGRQLEGISVEVSCFENTPGLRFLARDVEALPAK